MDMNANVPREVVTQKGANNIYLISVQKGPCVGSNCMCLVTWRLSNLKILCKMPIPTTRYWLIHSAFITERISISLERKGKLSLQRNREDTITLPKVKEIMKWHPRPPLTWNYLVL